MPWEEGNDNRHNQGFWTVSNILFHGLDSGYIDVVTENSLRSYTYLYEFIKTK